MSIHECEFMDTRVLFIESFGEKQRERYIDRCPRCGKHNMCASDGITVGYLSKLADVLICAECCSAEFEEEQQESYLSLPLSGWSWFDPKSGWTRFGSENKE